MVAEPPRDVMDEARDQVGGRIGAAGRGDQLAAEFFELGACLGMVPVRTPFDAAELLEDGRGIDLSAMAVDDDMDGWLCWHRKLLEGGERANLPGDTGQRKTRLERSRRVCRAV
jgi:hypothetical protein